MFSNKKVDLIMKCPERGCLNRNQKIKWHHECGGNLCIDVDGYIECKECGQRDKICRYTFNCGRHSAYRIPGRFTNPEDIIKCLSIDDMHEEEGAGFTRLLISQIKCMKNEDEFRYQ